MSFVSNTLAHTLAIFVALTFFAILAILYTRPDEEEVEPTPTRKKLGRIVSGGRFGSSRVELTDENGKVTYHDV